MPETHIIVFIKAPRPGYVKARLATSLGDKVACEAYRQLAETVLAKLTTLPNVEIHFSSDDAEDEIKGWLRKGWVAKPQCEGNRGQRMDRAFMEAGGAAIIVGSDCSYLELGDLEAACGALQTYIETLK